MSPDTCWLGSAQQARTGGWERPAGPVEGPQVADLGPEWRETAWKDSKVLTRSVADIYWAPETPPHPPAPSLMVGGGRNLSLPTVGALGRLRAGEGHVQSSRKQEGQIEEECPHSLSLV